MATLTVTFNPPSTAPANGYVVRYRIKGSTGAYTTVTPNPTSSPVVINGVLEVTEYEGDVKSDCGNGNFSDISTFETCTCPSGYTRKDDGSGCVGFLEQEPNIFQSDICLAISTNNVYTQYFSRIYNSNFVNEDLDDFSANPSHVYAELNTHDIWRNTNSNSTEGPLNRSGVWMDSNCDGIKDNMGHITAIDNVQGGEDYTDGVYLDEPLLGGTGTGARADITVTGGAVSDFALVSLGVGYSSGDVLTVNDAIQLGGTGSGFSVDVVNVYEWVAGSKLSISFSHNNTGQERVVYVGIAADNLFSLVVNGVEVAQTLHIAADRNFKIWHVIPVTLREGLNDFNAVATSDGSVNDSIGMEVYDRTAAQLAAATTLSDLGRLFSSEDLVGTHIDVATCNEGWSLDASGGQGNYVCRQISEVPCGS